ncbi:MAG: cache domain-containing protein [Pseudomonadota bacterium]
MKLLFPIMCCVVLTSSFVQAKEEFASAKEAEVMVGKAVAAIKANKTKTLEEITAKDNKWVDRDLYIVVYTLEGKVLSHGQNAKMVGKDLIDFKDPEGKLFIKERVELAKQKGKFWQTYVFTDPLSHKPLAKQSYCEKLDDLVVCGGIYKR